MTSKVKRAVREMRDYLDGKTEGFRVTTYEVPDVKAIRAKLGLTQNAFAQRFNLSLATVRDWEHGRRVPDKAAQSLLKVIAHNPRMAARAIAAA
jgi:putative transcriptional regulator